MILIKGKCATICILCKSPQSIFIAPDRSRLTKKFPNIPALVRLPKLPLIPTNALVKAVFGIIFGALIFEFVPAMISLFVSAE